MAASRARWWPRPTAAPSTTSTVPVTTPPPSTVTVTAAPPPVTVTAPPSPASPAPSFNTPQYPQSSSLQQLRAQANRDYPIVTTWANNLWFPQLSSKQPGTFDDGISWNSDSIWREHLQLRQQYGAVLLWSGDWPRTFTTAGLLGHHRVVLLSRRRRSEGVVPKPRSRFTSLLPQANTVSSGARFAGIPVGGPAGVGAHG